MAADHADPQKVDPAKNTAHSTDTPQSGYNLQSEREPSKLTPQDWLDRPLTPHAVMQLQRLYGNHFTAKLVQQKGQPMTPAKKQVQRVFDLINKDGKSVPKGNKDEIADTLIQALKDKKSVLKQYDSEEEANTIDTYLENPKLREKIFKLLDNTTDYGEVNVNNNQQLGFFYLKLKQLLDPKQRKGQLESAGDEGTAKAEEFIEGLKSKSYDERVRHAVGVWEGEEEAKKIEKVYKLVLLGRGATVAYYIADNLSNIDVENSILIGEEQPWRKKRGSQGVINHPMNMIAPEYQGKDLLDENGGLAKRQDFSDKVDEVLTKSNIKLVNAKVTSVKKQGAATKYYRIEAGGQVYYAQNVVAGMGIGKHLVPKDIKESVEKQEQIKKGENALPNKMPRVMDMDEFQSAISDGTLKPGEHFKTMVISGPNAAIDVATTAIRNAKAIEEVSWIATNPAFLPGTDNVDAAEIFGKAFPKDSKDKVKKEGIFTFYRYYYDSVEVNDKGVEVKYGTSGKDRKIIVEGTIKADLMVYGLGPDSAELEGMFKVSNDGGKERNLPLEAIYDINQHFNATPTSPEEIQKAIVGYFDYQNKEKMKKEFYDLVKVGEAIEQTKSIIPITAIQHKSETEPLFKTPVSNKLPGVVGLKAKKEDPRDESSLQMLGGMAFRLAGEKQYTYVSDMLQDILGNDLPKLEKTITEPKLETELELSVTSYLSEAKKFVQSTLVLAKELETAKKDDFEKKEGDVKNLKKEYEKLKEALDKFLEKLTKENQLIITGNRDRILNAVEMLEEYFASRKTTSDDQKLTNYMLKGPKTLPQNVLLPDQLTSTRSSVEAATDAMPSQVEEGVNFITSNNSVIAAHIASAYGDIPPALADYLTARIIYDRRNLPLEEAPLPQGNNEKGFNLEQQKKFQKDWNSKLGNVDALWDVSKIKK